MFITDIFKRALLKRDIIHNHKQLVKQLLEEIGQDDAESVGIDDYLAIRYRGDLLYREITLIYAAMRAGTNKVPGTVYQLLRSIVQRPDDMYFIAKAYTRIFTQAKSPQVRLTKSMRKAFKNILERSVWSKAQAEVEGAFTLNQLARWQGNGDLKKIIRLCGVEILYDRNKVPRYKHSIIAAFMENEADVPVNKAPQPATMRDAWDICAGEPRRIFTPYDLLPIHYEVNPQYNSFTIKEAAAITVANIKDIPIKGDCAILLHYPDGPVTNERKIASLTAHLLSIKLKQPYFLIGKHATVKVERSDRPFEDPIGKAGHIPESSETVIVIAESLEAMNTLLPTTKNLYLLNPWASEGVVLDWNKTILSLRDARTLEAIGLLHGRNPI